MTSLFNYKLINVELVRKTTSLHIDIRPPKDLYRIDHLTQICLELTHIIDWASKYIEISSIAISGLNSFSLVGLKPEVETKEILTLLSKVQEFTYALKYIPQTVIINFEKGASDIGIELAIGADIKISHTKATFNFDYLKIGLTPGCGMLGLLTTQISPAIIKGWLMMGEAVSARELNNCDFLTTIDDNPTRIKKITEIIKDQSQAARIQLKRSFLSLDLVNIDTIAQKEISYARSSLLSGDLVKYLKSNKSENFMEAKEFSNFIKSETMA